MKIDIVRGMLTEYNNLFMDKKSGVIRVLLDSFDGEEGRFLTHPPDGATYIFKFKDLDPLDDYLQNLVYRYEPNKNL